MKLLLFLWIVIPQFVYSQEFADKNYYLIDSLILNDLNQYDRALIDSCIAIYHNKKEDTIKLGAISHIAENCMDGNIWPKYNLWIYNYTKDKTGILYYNKQYTYALSNIGYIYKNQGQITKALKYYDKALTIQRSIKDKEGIANTLNNIGIIYDNLGLVTKASEYFHHALNIYKENQDKDGIAISLNNIGSIYERQGHLVKGLEYYYKALDIYNILDDQEGIANSFNNIGSNYNYQGQDTEALNYYHKALTIQTTIGDMAGLSTSLNNIGSIYTKQKQVSKALDYYHKALIICKETEDKEGIAHSLNNIGIIYSNQGDLIKGLDYLTRGYKLANDIGYPYYITTSSKELSQIAIQQNNFKEAYDMYKIHITMRDSINNIETQKSAILTQTKYDYEIQKTIDDAENQKLMVIEKEQKEKQTIITNSVLAGIALLALFLGFVFNRLLITKKQKIEIESQKLIVEQQKQNVEYAYKKTEEQKEIIELAHKEITDSINYALRLQKAILPSFSTIDNCFNNFILFKPKDVVSGDFYWFENKIVNGREISFFASADCTGHGVPGAMVSVVCSSALNRAVNEFGLIEPSKILDKTRILVIETFAKSGGNVKDGMDIALCVFENNKIIFSGANNPLWIIRGTQFLTTDQLNAKSTLTDKTQSLIEFKGDKQPIGIYHKTEPFTQIELDLVEGDILYFFTDGYADQFGGQKGKKFKYKALKKLLLEISNKPMFNQKQILDQRFIDWKGELDQIDDVCIIGVRPKLK